jgi:hypothetical protein
LIAIGAAVPARSSRRFGIAKYDDTVDALAHLILGLGREGIAPQDDVAVNVLYV